MLAREAGRSAPARAIGRAGLKNRFYSHLGAEQSNLPFAEHHPGALSDSWVVPDSNGRVVLCYWPPVRSMQEYTKENAAGNLTASS